MFPIKWNDIFRKKDGTLVNMEDITGGGGGNANVIKGETDPSSDEGEDGDIYLKVLHYDSPPDGYDFIEYLGITTAGPYIDTGVEQKVKSYFELDFQYTGIPAGDTWIFGTGSGANANEIGYYSGSLLFYIANSGYSRSIDALRHVFEYREDGCFADGALVNNRVGVDWSGIDYYIFARNNGTANGFTSNARVYGCKIYDDNTLVRNLVPVKQRNTDVIGLYDLVNNEFYTNQGTGSFVGGNVVTGDYVVDSYIKVSGVWQELNGSVLPT